MPEIGGRQAAALAVLGITVEANGAIRDVGRLDTALGKLGGTSKTVTTGVSELGAIQLQAAEHAGAHSLGINRLERAMSGGIEKAVGMNNVLGLLGTTFLKFGVGDIYTIAIVGGLYAIVKAWDAITSASREAQKAQDDALQAARTANFNAGPGGSAEGQQYGVQLKAYHALEAQRSTHDSYGMSTTEDDVRLRGMEIQLQDTWMRLKRGFLPDVTTSARSQQTLQNEADAQARQAREDAARYAELIRSTSFSPLSLGYARTAKGSVGSTYTPQGMTAAESGAIGDQAMSSINAENKSAQDASLFLAVQAYKDGTGKTLSEQQKSSQKISDAVWGAAAAGANAIVSALNIGGGGKGSNLGGALGSTAGFAIGYAFGGGPVGGAIGATAGNIFGSLVGGLFDHKKSVDRNTIALNNLTAHLSNAPGGFKVNGYNYGASDAKELYRSQVDVGRRLAARGGKNGFQLQAG